MSTQTLPVFILEDAVLFPGAVARLEADEAGLAQARAAFAGDRRVAVALRKESDDLVVHPLAVIARLEQVAEGGVIVTALQRARVLDLHDADEGTTLTLEPVAAVPAQASTEIDALVVEARRLAHEIFALLPAIPQQLAGMVDSLRDPSALADLLAHHVPGSSADKQRALEALDVEARLRIVVDLLARRREVLSVAHDIAENVQESVSNAEREHLLRRKLEAIRRELGESDSPADDAGELARVLTGLQLPAEVRAQVDKELARLKKLPEASPERGVARGWLQWIADLPWGQQAETRDNLDLENARRVLDEDHQGLEKVKKRVLQFLAVRTLRGDLRGPIILLAGPPGVGKTSLGQSIARALGRKFVRVSLGGVRDEAEIRGHRRTYVGAMPGRIVQGLKRAGSSNPVMLLDELDKLAVGAMGDPSAALLEVLDPEQNRAFSDHFLEVPVDLSKVLFLATANQLDTIPAPLRDRLEIVELPGYTAQEKQAIARAHLLPKQLAQHGLAAGEVNVTAEALDRIIQGHTREAGVRALERRLADVCRALAVEKASGTLTGVRTVDATEIEALLGPDRFGDELRDTTAAPGVAAGLAWTPVGGEVLYIEALRMPGRGKLILTGQLGEVMKESAQAALSYAKSHAQALGVPAQPLEGMDLHVHVPAGATPKDGPSAGVTMFTALVSLLADVPVRSDVAMTGEVTLRGRVLPVGGVKEKVLAAHRLGMRRVILPRACERDLRDVPRAVRDEVEFVFVDRMEQVLDAALVHEAPLRLAA